MTSIFISHSRKDWNVIQVFLAAFKETNVRPILMEYEQYSNPPWYEIKNKISESSALFVLLGSNLNTSPYTSNWITWEAGIADTAGKEIWVFEDIYNQVSFPLPNAHHYVLYNRNQQESMNYLITIIGSYGVNGGGALVGGLAGLALTAHPIAALIGALVGSKLDIPDRPEGITVGCPYPDCRITFHFYNGIKQLLCPACRRGIRLN